MIGGPIEIAIILTLPVELAARRARKAKPGREQAAKARVHFWRALQGFTFSAAFAFWLVYAVQTWEYAAFLSASVLAFGLGMWQLWLQRRVLREPVRAA
jgi:hypothetical protein